MERIYSYTLEAGFQVVYDPYPRGVQFHRKLHRKVFDMSGHIGFRGIGSSQMMSYIEQSIITTMTIHICIYTHMELHGYHGFSLSQLASAWCKQRPPFTAQRPNGAELRGASAQIADTANHCGAGLGVATQDLVQTCGDVFPDINRHSFTT